MKRAGTVAILLLTTFGLASAAGEKNAWGSFKIGSWVKTRCTHVMQGPSMKVQNVTEGTTTLTALTADEATLEQVVESTETITGQPPTKKPKATYTQKVPLAKLNFPTEEKGPKAGAPKADEPKVEQAEERLTVAGKKVKCRRIRMAADAATLQEKKLPAEYGWANLTIEAVIGAKKASSTVWLSDEVPGMIARFESASEGDAKSTMTMEVLGFEAK